MNAAVRAVLATALLAGGVALAAEPDGAQPAPGGVQRAVTLEDVDEGLRRLRNSIWSMPPEMQRLTGPDGGSLEKDIATHVLTEESLKRIAAVREEIARNHPPGTPIAPAALAPMTALLVAEYCHMGVLAGHWGAIDAENHHRVLVTALIERAPATERAEALEKLKDLQRRAAGNSGQLASSLQRCGEGAAGDALPVPDYRTFFEEYNALRAGLAEKIGQAEVDAGVYSPEIKRVLPCPAPAAPVIGGRTRVLKRGDPSAHYPRSASSREISGSVRVRLRYDATGCVTSASVLRSSGSPDLDEGAVDLAFEFQFAVAESEAEAGGGAVVLPVTFSVHDWQERIAGPEAAQPQP